MIFILLFFYFKNNNIKNNNVKNNIIKYKRKCQMTKKPIIIIYLGK